MKSSRKELKQKSKDQLRGQWTKPVLITLLLLVYSIVIRRISNGIADNMVSSLLFSILTSVISCILGIAITSFYLKLGRGKDIEFSDLLIEGRTMGKGIGVEVLTTIMLIPLTIVCVIIFVLIAVFGFGSALTAYPYIDMASMALSIFWLIIVALLVISVPIMIIGSYFALAIIFICEDNNRGVWECIKLSFQHMNGNLWRYILLQLSFIGWGIVCIFTLGIGLLWLIPYVTLTEINFFNDVTGYDDRNLTTNYSDVEF